MSFWIMANDRPTSPKFYYFSKEFSAPAGASFKASACGDTRYALYLNGHLVLEGPCQGSAEAFCYYDRRMNYGMHNGDYTVSVATSGIDVHQAFEARVREGKVLLSHGYNKNQ